MGLGIRSTMGLGLRDIGATLPPGFRFYPSDEELVCHYLCKKITNEQVLKGTLVEIDLHTCEPWQLPEVAKLNANEWYFFSFRDRKYATGFRTNRATISGYWKATGKDRTVIDPATKEIVGMRKTLVFYRNRAPNGIKTGWIMHEFRLETPHTPPKEDWVLCRVFHKSKSADENNTNDHQFMYETTETNHSTTTTTTNNNNNATLMIRSSLAPASSSSLPNLPNDHHEPCGYHHHQQVPSLSTSSTPPHHHHHHQIHDQGSFLNLLQQEIRNQSSSNNNNLVTSTAHDQILCSSKGVETNIDDEYDGFLWDEMNFEEANLEENHMRISYDDGSVVFL